MKNKINFLIIIFMISIIVLPVTAVDINYFNLNQKLYYSTSVNNIQPISVTTLPASDITYNSVTLNGLLTNSGQYNAECYFYWWEGDPYSYREHTNSKTIQYGSFSETLNNLHYNQDYYFQAVAKFYWPYEEFLGEMLHFKTCPLPPDVETLEASDINYTSAKLNGRLKNLYSGSCKVWFMYGKNKQNLNNYTNYKNLHSKGDFDFIISGLENDTQYYFQAMARIDFNNPNCVNIDYGRINSFYTLRKHNIPPNKPIINGSESGKAGNQYNYTIVTIDSEGDYVSYYVDWDDDNNSGWTKWLSSGQEYNISHIWNEQGTYKLRVKAKDEYNAESDWTTLEISMPISKSFYQIPRILFWLFERFPFLQPYF